MAEFEEVPYDFLIAGDVFRMTDTGQLWRVVQWLDDGKIEIKSKAVPQKIGKPDPKKIVQVRTVQGDAPTDAGVRHEQKFADMLAPLDPLRVCAEKMTPGEVAMHLTLHHGIEATGYASVNMPPRERGTSLRDTHAADHAGAEEHGWKHPQIAHVHDQEAFMRGEQKWVGSPAKTR